MRLAIVGIRGLPNSYGGFETLADNLVEYLAKEIDITVYCSSIDMRSKLDNYKGANLEYVSITSHGALGVVYDSIALLKAVHKFDTILFLGFGGGFIMPFIRKKHKEKIILNIGGLDWKRNKWNSFAQKIIKKAEELLVKNSGKIISDNTGIQTYLLKEYNKESTLIAYGGDQAKYKPVTAIHKQQYPFLETDYAFTVARIQSDNNIEMILEAFLLQRLLPVVIVGNWQDSSYGKKIKQKYSGNHKLNLLDAIYDREKLDVLRSNCTLYIHGHSAGGTNPALTEAMYLGLPVLAFASGYNEYTTENKALYFMNAEELAELVQKYKKLPLKQMAADLKAIADEKYRWRIIAEKYKSIFLSNVE